MSQTATTKTESGKVIPDEGTLDGDFELTANDKVQLDIDDAPFLLDPDEEEAPPPVLSAERSLITRETTETGKGKKKLIAVIIILALATAGIGTAIGLFVLKKSGWRKSPTTATAATDTPPVVVVPATPAAPPPPAEYNLKLAPFWVPVKTPANEDRFLVATFVLNTKDAVLNTEMQDKLTTLRDSIYYYLSNKDYAFLTDPASAESIREDLIEAINHYLVQGELKNLYFDQYILQ